MRNKTIFVFLLMFVFIIRLHSQKVDPVYFVQITDTHLGKDDHNERMEKIVKSINQLPFDISCVVHTGDIFQNNIMDFEVVKEGLAILNKIKYPIHFVPGNHDILYYEYEENMQQYLKFFKTTDTIVVYKDLAFVFIYTEPFRDNKIKDKSKSFENLENYLNDCKMYPTIVLHHTPSVEDFYNLEIHHGWVDENYEKWVDVLNKYNVKAVIAGHFHRGELHWLKNIPLYISPSVAGFWGRQASYRVYEFSNGKLSYWTVYIE